MQYARFLSGILWYKLALVIIVCTFLPPVHAQQSLLFETNTFIRPQYLPMRPLRSVVFLDRGSTLGFGVEATKDVSPKVDVRISFGQFRNFDRSRKADVDYRLEEKLRSASLLLDWHPFGGSFRTSIGVSINRHTLHLDAVPNQSFNLSNKDITTLSMLSQSDMTDAALDSIDLSIIKLSENILGTLDPNDTTVKASDLLTAKSQVEFGGLATYAGTGMGSLPVIRIEDADYKQNRVLYLTHAHDGRDLELGYAEKTLAYVYQLWGREVRLETNLQGSDYVFSYDDDGFNQRRKRQ